MKILNKLLILSLFSLFFPYLVSAQSKGSYGSNLGISPAIINNIAYPNKLLKGKLDVINLTSLPLPVSATLTSFSPNDLIAIPESKRSIYDASTWITLSEPDFIIQPKSKRTIYYTIKVPKNAEAGGHYATILFQPLVPQEALSPQSLYVIGRVGALMLITVPGDIKESLEINKFEVSQSDNLINIHLEVENNGNVHIRPNGKIFVLNNKGKVIFGKSLNEGLIIPGTIKNYDVSFDKKYIFGKFRTEAHIIYGSSDSVLDSKSFWFWIIPFISLIPILLFGLFFIFLIFILKKRLVLAGKVLLGFKV